MHTSKNTNYKLNNNENYNNSTTKLINNHEKNILLHSNSVTDIMYG